MSAADDRREIRRLRGVINATLYDVMLMASKDKKTKNAAAERLVKRWFDRRKLTRRPR